MASPSSIHVPSVPNRSSLLAIFNLVSSRNLSFCLQLHQIARSFSPSLSISFQFLSLIDSRSANHACHAQMTPLSYLDRHILVFLPSPSAALERTSGRRMHMHSSF
ncbi:hypothetical protein A0H81_10838 [Grifola frondosa]|uniref:Uncharacterized protein n=1 Tax=Grifola frondosa TaxID=5627 RepID=A0A1C7LXI7_GRIFR|nr:hypothetical protein A0H81_10838 [Grifola frondosa]